MSSCLMSVTSVQNASCSSRNSSLALSPSCVRDDDGYAGGVSSCTSAGAPSPNNFRPPSSRTPPSLALRICRLPAPATAGLTPSAPAPLRSPSSSSSPSSPDSASSE
eukprot:7376086-Prymnesium_polylepis.1